MTPETDRNIDGLVREKLEGKSYSEIRARLLEDGLTSGEVKQLIRKVDERVLEATENQGRPDRFRQMNRAGLILAIIGLAISIAFNAGLILQRLPAIVVYTPFFTGILIMFYGRMMQRRKPEKRDTGPGPIRKRRPYK